jgi:uncharacterized membrane-anchored protein
MYIEGIIKVGKRTKDLVKYLTPMDIAVIQHDDIDELAAEALIEAGPKAVINTGSSMTGSFFARGASMLIKEKIRLYDTYLSIELFKDQDTISIRGRDLVINDKNIYTNVCNPVNEAYIYQKSYECRLNETKLIKDFVDNTLRYAAMENRAIMDYSDYPELSTRINGRIAIVAVRSCETKEALLSLQKLIEEKKPVLIGVDGGADTIISCGFIPDILIGDMDSVSDLGIYRSKEVVLHAYSDGSCPCIQRISALNVRFHLLPMPGTSEDIALLLAYAKGASSIILIGGHSSMEDFLNRGRKGMGSTILARLKVADRLIDYKHVRRLNELTREEAYYKSCNIGDLLWMKQ